MPNKEIFLNKKCTQIKNLCESFFNEEDLISFVKSLKEKLSNNNVYRLIDLLDQLKKDQKTNWNIKNGCIEITSKTKPTEEFLNNFIPWRKGPFKINDIFIDTEWKCNKKWQRIINHINLENKTVLDIGCGSGYFLFLMKHHGARQVIGIDPMELFYFQFLIINHYCKEKNIHFIPTKWQHFKKGESRFNTIFCMGVLYHQKQPKELLTTCYELLKNSGELILETLIINNNKIGLIPKGRYANMRNVYLIPTVKECEQLLKNVGFKDITCISIDPTTENEQRRTRWSPGYSLYESLDPNNNELTVEGHQKPIRAILIAKK
tara:strand:+ start:2396 stop:3355 length:960 start_codon:yes stop_codon:yes gene_type:complete